MKISAQTQAIRKITGFNLLNDTHTHWISQCWREYTDTMVFPFLAARGSYKTTSIIIAGAFLALLEDPELEIVLFRKTFDMACSVLKALIKLFERAGVTLEEGSSHRLKLADKSGISPMANISAFGMGDSVTGVHADIIIADDIITLLDKTSEAERRRTLDFVNEFFRLRKTPKSRIIITGTRWHKQDAWRRIEQFAPPVLYPADKCPWLDSETLQKENSPQDWVLNYLLEYPQDSESVFNNIQYEGFPLDSWKKEKVIMHIDAAYSLHEGGDSTALTILGGNHVLGKLWQGAYFNHIGEFADLFHKYHCCKVYCEDNDRGIAARDLTAAGLPCETYHESRNKANKISSMLKPSVWEALRFSPETDEAYLSQVLDWAYNTKGHDDAPDSLACAVGIRDSKFREQKVSGLFTIGGYQ